MVLCSSLRTNLKFTTFFLWGLFLKCLQSLPTHSAINILFFSLSFSKLSKRLSEQTLISEYLSISQEVHLLLTLTSFPVNRKNTHQTDVETSKRKKSISERSLVFPYWTLSFPHVHSAFTPGEHLRPSHDLLCYRCSQMRQAWASSVKYFCKDWCNISSDVLPKWKKWLLGMKACSQPEAEVCSYLDNLRKWLFSPLFFADHSVFG